MKKILNALYSLDMREHIIISEKKAIEKSISEIRDNIQILKANIEKSEKELLAIKKKLASLNNELKILEEKENTINNKILSVNSEKQLAAYNSELETLKGKKNIIEDEILEKMDAEESLLSKLDGFREKFEESSDILKKLEKELKNHIDSNQLELEKISNEREEFLSSIDSQIKRKYQRLKTKFYNPVVPIKKSSCSGCMLSVSASVINDIKDKEYSECQSCKRILIAEV